MTQRRRWRRSIQLAACTAALLAVAGCSLLSFKSPERPLSTRDLNARILTRELSAEFVTAVIRGADEIDATEKDPVLLENTLRWEIAAVGESRRAATRMAPMMSLLDTWALAVQIKDFTSVGGPGGSLFGVHQQSVQAISDKYADDAQALARRLIAPRDLPDYQRFVADYVREHPLRDLDFARPSVVDLWSREKGAETRLVDSLGTIPEAMADTTDRLQIYGETVPSQLMRRTQLALLKAGYSQSDLQSSLRALDERLERLTEVAESSPELVKGAEADFRASLREVLARLDASSVRMIDAVHSERGALFADLQSEREAVLAAVDVQRKALALDAGRLADQVVRSAGAQVRYLAGEVLGLLIVLTALLLGLPFAAGYLLGRSRQDRKVRDA
jgi:hypothetical protein